MNKSGFRTPPAMACNIINQFVCSKSDGQLRGDASRTDALSSQWKVRSQTIINDRVCLRTFDHRRWHARALSLHLMYHKRLFLTPGSHNCSRQVLLSRGAVHVWLALVQPCASIMALDAANIAEHSYPGGSTAPHRGHHGPECHAK